MSIKAILGIMLATCILISSNGYAFSIKDKTSDIAQPKATVAKTNAWTRPPCVLQDIFPKHTHTGKEQPQYTRKQLEKARKAGIHAPAFPRELPHVWKVYTFEKCSYYKKLAFQKNDNNMVSIIETNQNFSRVACIVDENASAPVLKKQ